MCAQNKEILFSFDQAGLDLCDERGLNYRFPVKTLSIPGASIYRASKFKFSNSN